MNSFSFALMSKIKIKSILPPTTKREIYAAKTKRNLKIKMSTLPV